MISTAIEIAHSLPLMLMAAGNISNTYVKEIVPNLFLMKSTSQKYGRIMEQLMVHRPIETCRNLPKPAETCIA